MTALHEWNGEKRTISGWARHLKTTRDKVRTRIKRGLRLDADTIDGVHRPLRPSPRRGRPAVVEVPSVAVLDHVAVVRLVRAIGYACEARVLDGEEVLVVREVAR